jgi:hypothetical protein
MENNDLKKIALEIMKYLESKLVGSKLHSPPEAGIHQILSLPNGYSLRYQKWCNGRKPHFLMVYYKENYLMEFDLSRIIYHETNGRYTWILREPTRDKNKENLTLLGYGLEPIPEWERDQIYQQMVSINTKAERSRHNGYYLARNKTQTQTIQNFTEVVKATIILDNNFLSEGEEGEEILQGFEGETARYKNKQYKRNVKLLKKRKRLDNYMCQACDFQLEVEGKYVIECHHKNPLRGEAMTRLEDLISLCPTCHRIAHKRKPHPFELEQIKELLDKNKGVG